MKAFLLVAALISSAPCAFSQGSPVNLDGKWVAEWNSPQGRPISADLEMRGGEGTWRQRVLGRTEDPCIKVAAPVSVENSSTGNYVHIQRSKVVPGCQDSRLTLSTGPNGEPAGAWRDGREVKLTR